MVPRAPGWRQDAVRSSPRRPGRPAGPAGLTPGRRALAPAPTAAGHAGTTGPPRSGRDGRHGGRGSGSRWAELSDGQRAGWSRSGRSRWRWRRRRGRTWREAPGRGGQRPQGACGRRRSRSTSSGRCPTSGGAGARRAVTRRAPRARVSTAVEVRGLRVVRGRTTALDGVDLDVAAGAVTGLLGPSGSGKTTLMRCVLGVQRVAAGRVTVLGHPAGSRELRRRIGYVTQAPSVYPDLTVEENLRYFARVLGVDGRARGVTTVAEALDVVGLAGSAASSSGRSRAGSSPGSPSPRPCSAPPTCSCSTSRPWAWTRCCASRCGRTFRDIAAHGHDAARLLPRHGRGGALRRAGPAPGGPGPGAHHAARAAARAPASPTASAPSSTSCRARAADARVAGGAP